MPDTISYLVELTGASFNDLLDSEDQLPQNYFEKLTDEGDYREVHLEGNRQPIGVDLTGEWTEIGLAYPYSALLDETATVKAVGIRKKIDEWERHLRSRLPSTEIFRMKGSLFEEWEDAAGEPPLRNSQSVHRFLEWLVTQDTRYWTRLPSVAPSAE